MEYTIELRDADRPPLITPKLIWTDIPFNTGDIQRGQRGHYVDDNADLVLAALVKWAQLLPDNGVMIVCCDYRMAWKVCHKLSGTLNYQGEIVWEFGLGRPRSNWWPVRHNNLLTFTVGDLPHFDSNAVPRAKRLAPKAGYPNDKPMGSVWDFTMSNTNPQRVGYPNQKPIEIIEPFVLAHTEIGDLVADPFCGSSSTGIAAIKHGRNYYGSDTNHDAIAISQDRLGTFAYGQSRE